MERSWLSCTRSRRSTTPTDVEIEKLFPLIKAAPPLINDEEWQPEVEEPDDEVERVDGSLGRASRARGKTRGQRRAGGPAE